MKQQKQVNRENYVIYLGSKCNTNCAYCFAQSGREDIPVSESFLEELSKKDSLYLKFGGGEPLLYMDKIKLFVKACPQADFCIATNGLLISQYIDFLNENNIFVHISWDGAKSLRKNNGLTFAVKNLKRWIASATLGCGNSDLFKLIEEVDKKSEELGFFIPLFVHLARATNENNKNYVITKKESETFINQFKNIVYWFMLEYQKFGSINKRYYPFFMFLEEWSNKNLSWGETLCNNRSWQKVDCAGNRYPCLYVPCKPLKEDWFTAQQSMIPVECKNCNVYQYCGGGCLMSKNREVECNIYKELFTWFPQIKKKMNFTWEKQ